MRESPRRAGLPLVLLVLGLFLLIVSEAGYLTSVENAFHYVLDPLQRLFSGVVGAAGNVRALFEVRQLRAEVEDLRTQVDALTLENVSLRDYRAEVQSLRALLNFAEEFSITGYLGADVIGRESCATFPCGEVIGEEPNPYLYYVTINVGAQQGVEVGMPVVSAAGGLGLIGRIAEVAPRTSKVQLLTDSESSIAALLQTSRATGLVVGQSDGTLRMEYIPQEESVQLGESTDDQQENVTVGDIVMTSGLGGVMPKGLVIGQVAEVQQMDYALFQAAVVRPAVDFSRLELVLVLTAFEEIPLEEPMPTPTPTPEGP